MASDISISISAKDNYTSTMKKVRETTAAFSKDADGLAKRLATLNSTKADIKVEIASAKKRLQEAERAFKATGDAAAKMNFKSAQLEVESLADSLQAVSREAKTVKKEIGGLDAQYSKAQNRIGGSSGSSTSAALGKFLKAQMAGEVGSALGGLASQYITSAFGAEAGNMAGNMLGNGLSMGAAGAAVAGVPGAVVGALAGLATGGVQAYTEQLSANDDYFKSAVQTEYSESVQNRETRLANGTQIAVQRQIDQAGFSKLLGSAEEAAEYLSWAREFGATTPFQYDDLVGMSKALSTYGYGTEEMKVMLGQIGDTGAALGLSGADMTAVATYLGRMKSSNKTTLEYLNPLIERGIPVIDYLAEGLGKSKTQIYDMVSKGLIPGEKAAAHIAESMGRDYSGAMAEQSSMYNGLVSNLEEAEANLDAALGEGYTETRKLGLERQQDWYGNDEKYSRMEGLNRVIGQWEAMQDNAESDALLSAYDELIEKTEALSLPANPDAWTSEQKAAVQKIYEEYAAVASKAQTKYYQSEAGKAHIDAEKGIINNLQMNVVQEWQSYGAAISREISKGMTGAQHLINQAARQAYVDAMEDAPGVTVEYFRDNGNQITMQISDSTGEIIEKEIIKEDMVPDGATIHGNAFGLSYVPYDGYPAVLHQGERVLTASEARNYGGSTMVSISGNTFYVREEADIDKIASQLADKLSFAAESYAGN